VELLSHLGFDKLDLKIKRKSIEAQKPEKEIREELVRVSDREDVLSLVQYPKEYVMKVLTELSKNEQKEKEAEENQATGRTVEAIIREILLENKIKPDIVYEGADIEIWPEKEGWDGGKINISPYYVEIKFTTGNRARLSKKQAESAKEVKQNYFILVVEGDVSLKQKLLDYNGLSIKEKLEIRRLVEESSHLLANRSQKLMEAPAPEEVEPDINGYWVKKGLWLHGEKLQEWISKRVKKRTK